MKTRLGPTVLLAVLIGTLTALSAETTWTFRNITSRTYTDECFRIPLAPPGDKCKVTEDGKEIPCVVDNIDGRRDLWVRSSFEPDQARTFQVSAGSPADMKPVVKVLREGAALVIDNGTFAVKVPAEWTAGNAPAPILAVRVKDGWSGRGAWASPLKLKSFKVTTVDDGRVFGKIRLRYDFDGVAGMAANLPAYAEVDVTVMPNVPFAIVEERHEMPRLSAWEFEVKGTSGIIRSHSSAGFSGGRPDALKGTLKPGQIPFQRSDLLINLFPRWNQGCKDGWYGAAATDDTVIGALVTLAGRWYWPHDNAIACLVRESGDSMTLRCPTVRGMRYWFLIAGNKEAVADVRSISTRYGFESVDNIVRTVPVREWEGATGKFQGYWPLDSAINPTGGIRGAGRNALKNAGNPVKSIGHLTQTQVLLSPDIYGSYWLYWSPENPNFFTDFMQWPIGLTCNLKDHPRFKELAKIAEDRFREDVYHSVTMPSGAGQECPGYSQYALKHYIEIAEVCKKYLGFDATEWPQFKAAASFLIRISQPLGAGKRGSHPGGDTHPGYVFADPREFAAKFGVSEDVTTFKSVEIPGFGAVFRNRPGSEQETYLAFKSGPSRGHFHGDQLSFHYCKDSAPAIVDHHCSYGPHAAQEHMHNRVAFHTDAMPYANMDGFERLIAFKSGKSMDAAVGQVESWRLRNMKDFPPANWHEEYPQVEFKEPLKYRRTIVMVRGDKDYFVIRDQFTSDTALNATFCLHPLGDKAEQQGKTVIFDKASLFIAAPAEFKFAPFSWTHSNGGPEKTTGCRLTVKGNSGEFITVMYPDSVPPKAESIPGGVKVGNDEIVFAGGIDDVDNTVYVSAKRSDGENLTLTGKDIDLDRSQGDIGLFVPDAGYPFGEIPEWLIRQRIKAPDWAPDWVKELRGRPQ